MDEPPLPPCFNEAAANKAAEVNPIKLSPVAGGAGSSSVSWVGGNERDSDTGEDIRYKPR
jgi:hypothetical protein